MPGRSPRAPHALSHLVCTTAGEVASIISSRFTSGESEAQRLSDMASKWQKQDVEPALNAYRDSG